jgi:hypothetical protein
MLQNIKSNKNSGKMGKIVVFDGGILLMSFFRGKSFFENMFATFLTIARNITPLRRSIAVQTMLLHLTKILAAKELSQIFMKTCPLFF